MMTSNLFAQDGKAHTTKKTFSRETTVSILIEADQEIIWALLTNASDYPRWNSTVIALEGEIALGEKIKLTSTLDPDRTFKLKVKEVEPEKRMLWGDGKGKRTFLLARENEDRIRFTMTEKIGGLMFPLYAGFIPSFDDAFEQFAADLKKEAELIEGGKE